jgi:hypothetical protein
MIGLKELALLAVVVLVLYGRTGVLKSRRFQTIAPWISPVRRTSRQAGSGQVRTMAQSQAGATTAGPRHRSFLLEGNRLYWFLTILAATAVAAWIITRLLILSRTSP